MYDELTTGSHGIWPAIYNATFGCDWLFAHTTAVPEPFSFAALVLTVGFFFAGGRQWNANFR